MSSFIYSKLPYRFIKKGAPYLKAYAAGRPRAARDDRVSCIRIYLAYNVLLLLYTECDTVAFSKG